VTAFAHALGRFGWVEGKNVRIDYRFAAGAYPALSLLSVNSIRPHWPSNVLELLLTNIHKG
jgi:hypothetical protein